MVGDKRISKSRALDVEGRKEEGGRRREGAREAGEAREAGQIRWGEGLYGREKS